MEKLFTDAELEQIAKEQVPLSNDCFGELDYTQGKQDGFYEGMVYYRDFLDHQIKKTKK